MAACTEREDEVSMDAAQILAIAGGVITFLGGIIISGIRSTIGRLETTDKDFARRISALESQLSGLQSAHDTVMAAGGHGKRK